MKNKQLKAWKIQESVLKTLEKYRSAWKEVPELQSSFDHFVKNFKKIGDLQARLEYDFSPLVTGMAEVRQKLHEAMVPVARVLNLFAEDQKRKKLSRKVRASTGELKKMKPDALINYSDELIRLYEKEAATDEPSSGRNRSSSVEGYGLREEHVSNVREALKDFRELRKEYIDRKKQRKKNRRKLKKLLKENQQILKSRLDHMLSLFHEREPALYQAYHLARRGTDPSEGSGEKTGQAASRPGKSAGTGKKSPVKRPKPSSDAPSGGSGENRNTPEEPS